MRSAGWPSTRRPRASLPYDSTQHLVCFSFSADPGTALVVPLFHKDSPWRNDPLAIEEIYQITRELFSVVPACGWNLPFDFKWVWLKAAIRLSVLYDGFLGSRWLYGSKRLAHDLNTLASQILGFHGHGDAVKAEMAALKQLNERHYGNLHKDTLIRYAGGDADSALQLCEQDYLRMQSIVLGDGQTMLDKFNFMQTRALPRLTKMEMNGVKVSREINEYLKVEYVKTMKPLEDRVRLSSWGQRAAQLLLERRVGKWTTGDGSGGEPEERGLRALSALRRHGLYCSGYGNQGEVSAKDGASYGEGGNSQLD